MAKSNSKLEKVVTLSRPISLSNTGLNCYLNSCFQSIVACTRFVNDMKQLEYKFPSSKNLKAFNDVLQLLSGDGDRQDELELSSSAILQNWNRSGEQDTFEIFSFVVNQVFNELRKIKQQNLPLDERTIQNWNRYELPLKILMEFRIQCDRCGHKYNPSNQMSLALHLPVPHRVFSARQPFTLEDLLANHFQPEQISDFPCKNCTDGTVVKLSILKRPIPPTLCVHLQRSFWDTNTNVMVKNNERVLFEEKLVLNAEFFSECRTYGGGYLSEIVLGLCSQSSDLFTTNVGIKEGGRSGGSGGQNGGTGSENEDRDPLEKVLTGSTEVREQWEKTPGKPEPDDRNTGDGGQVLISTDEGDIGPEGDSNNGACKVSSWDSRETLDQTPGTARTVDTNEEHPVPIYANEENPSLEKDLNLNGEVKAFDSGRSPSQIDENSGESPLQNSGLVFTSSEENDLKASPSISVEKDNLTQSSMDTSKLLEKQQEDCKDEQFALKSVIVHFGSAETGHYICFRKCQEKWFCTNDNFVTEVSFKEVQNSQAYILMYEKEN